MSPDDERRAQIDAEYQAHIEAEYQKHVERQWAAHVAQRQAEAEDHDVGTRQAEFDRQWQATRKKVADFLRGHTDWPYGDMPEE